MTKAKATPTAPLIIVDDREPEHMAVSLQSYGLQAVVSRLQYGDYAFFAHGLTVLIELSTVSDLLGKLTSKRLVAQAHGLANTGDIAFIMVRGRYTEDAGQVAYQAPKHPQADSNGWVRSGWNWDSFQAIKADVMLLGIDFIDCPNAGDAAREIARLAVNLSKSEHKWLRQRTRPEVLTLDGEYKNAVWSLCAFDGIGPETATAMLEEYGSVLGIYIAATTLPAKDFCRTVDGLGPKRVKAFVEEITKKWQ
ncbi:hypothetical protein LCGC14_0581610 [marine sediment metagenome]|uniref:ERCC4 domain-containing protein n=1 Tax=marine sediment metagenome TaxID=412755 RepID=A0A0F9U2C7_9ZZZZ